MSHSIVNKRFFLLVVVAMAFVDVMDITVANYSLPYLKEYFLVSEDIISHIVSFYLFGSVVSVIFFKKLLNSLKSRNLLLISLCGYAFFSFLCGMSFSIDPIVFSRLFQGVFGGFLPLLCQVLISETFYKKERFTAIAFFSACLGFAPLVGPLVGGCLAHFFGWRAVFFVNLPVCVFCVFYVTFFMPKETSSGKELVSNSTFDFGLLLSGGFFIPAFSIAVFHFVFIGTVVMLPLWIILRSHFSYWSLMCVMGVRVFSTLLTISVLSGSFLFKERLLPALSFFVGACVFYALSELMLSEFSMGWLVFLNAVQGVVIGGIYGPLHAMCLRGVPMPQYPDAVAWLHFLKLIMASGGVSFFLFLYAFFFQKMGLENFYVWLASQDQAYSLTFYVASLILFFLCLFFLSSSYFLDRSKRQ